MELPFKMGQKIMELFQNGTKNYGMHRKKQKKTFFLFVTSLP